VTTLPPGGDYLLAPGDALAAQEQALAGCRRCKLCEARRTIVFGSGNPQADLVVIGEGPGADEDAQGKPFVGRAGQLLTKMLEAVKLTRDEVFITNTVKCFISPRVLIYTAEGYRPIKDIRVGDLVLTHRGHFRKVVFVRPHEKLPKGSRVIRFIVRGTTGTARPLAMTVTPEHPFHVGGSWKPASALQPGDRVSALGDRCQVCGKTFFVRHSRYDERVWRTCSPRCHNQLVFHSPEAREKVRRTMKEQYQDGRRDARTIALRANEVTRQLVAAGEAKIQHLTTEERVLRNHRGEYCFVEVVVVDVIRRRTRRDFPLYNIGVEDDESYVAAGIVSHNCRPPGNRNPEGDELAACAPFLAAQLGVIQPKVILALGSVATQALLKTKDPIGKLRGRAHAYGSAVLVPTFHPAYLLRNPGPEYKRMAFEDLKLARREYDARRAR
jgi:uracil-DNA glycosylase family 4